MRAFVPALLLLALVGCSGGSGETASTTGTTATTGSTSKPAEPAPLTGNVMTTKNGKLTFVAPDGWTKVDPSDKVFNDAVAKLDPAAKDQIVSGAAKVELMAMDFPSGASGFANNLNVVDSGAGAPSASELEAAMPGLASQFGGAKLEHKMVTFPIGPALSYWGTISLGSQSNDLLGYAFSAGGRLYVITFSSGKGKIESIRSVAEATMKTVQAK